jgi:hypothetical protein
MRYGQMLFVALLLSGCSSDGLSRASAIAVAPTAPTGPPERRQLPTPPPVDTIFAAASGWLQVMVIENSGACVDGAVIEIVSGPGTGFSGKQSSNCSVWEPWGGYFLYGLIVAEPIIIRASASGYGSTESTFYPSDDPNQSRYFIQLSRTGPPSIPLGQPVLERSH